MHGRWEGEPGERRCRLVGDELPQGGRPTRMTYEWSDITATDARWQQAYSVDDERTWEKNWEMRFHRTGDAPSRVPQDHLPKVTSDFDFLTGTWRVQHRKLRSRLTGCTDWDEYESRFEARTHLNGLVSIDEGALPHPSPYRGMTFRTYDVAAGEWALHWLDSRTLQMDTTPVRGRFVDGVGEFVAEDHHEGVPILCRFRWTVHGPERALVGPGVLDRRRQHLGDQLGDGGDPGGVARSGGSGACQTGAHAHRTTVTGPSTCARRSTARATTPTWSPTAWPARSRARRSCRSTSTTSRRSTATRSAAT